MHRTLAQNSQREGRSLPRQGRDHLFSGMLGSVWGSSRRLQIPYVILGPGVPRHMYTLSLSDTPLSEETAPFYREDSMIQLKGNLAFTLTNICRL